MQCPITGHFLAMNKSTGIFFTPLLNISAYQSLQLPLRGNTELFPKRMHHATKIEK